MLILLLVPPALYISFQLGKLSERGRMLGRSIQDFSTKQDFRYYRTENIRVIRGGKQDDEPLDDWYEGA